MKSAIPKLFSELNLKLGMTRSQCVHIASHCPFLVAQYAQYSGRDLGATVEALKEAGYDEKKFVDDFMRFPGMLATPPDRIRGWMSLLAGYGVRTEPKYFGKLLKRAPYMFYLNPPNVFDDPEECENEEAYGSDVSVSSTSTETVLYEALRVMGELSDAGIEDMDKLIRTNPILLAQSKSEIKKRLDYLRELCVNGNLFADKVAAEKSFEKAREGYSTTTSQCKLSQQQNDSDVIEAQDDTRQQGVEASALDRKQKRGSKWSSTNLRVGPTSQAGASASTLIATQKQAKEKMSGKKDINSGGIVDKIDDGKDSSIQPSAPTAPTESWRASAKTNIGNPANNTIDIASYGFSATRVEDDFDSTFTGRNMVNVTHESVCIREAVDYSALWAQNDDATRQHARVALSTLLSTFPTIMACSFQQMLDVEMALLRVGVRRRDLPHLIHKHPTILKCHPKDIYTVISFLQYNCGLRKFEAIQFVLRFPSILEQSIESLEPKVDYLFQSLGGTPSMLRQHPAYLSFDLDSHIRLRADLCAALDMTPLFRGLPFFLFSSANEFSSALKIKPRLYGEFKDIYFRKLKERKRSARENGVDLDPLTGLMTKQQRSNFADVMSRDSQNRFLEIFDRIEL
jgi:hypothetical protein